MNPAQQGRENQQQQQPPQPWVPVIPGKSRLAIDVGNVISLGDTDDSDAAATSSCSIISGDLADRLAQSQATKECAETCRLLLQLLGKDNLFILSKCGHRVQLATWKFLNNPVAGDHRSFLEISGILPRNILFCRERHGGSAPVRLIPLIEGQRNGPRTALEPVGKGAVAATIGLTHLIDDRADCLLSFFWEGHIWSKMGNVAQKTMKNKKKQRKAREGFLDSVTVGLIQFGPQSEIPCADRIESFALNAGIGASELGTSMCAESWFMCQNWEQVRHAFQLKFPDFFDVDKKAVSKTKKIVGVDEVAGNIVSVLKDQGYRHIGKRKISLETNSLSLLGFDIKQ